MDPSVEKRLRNLGIFQILLPDDLLKFIFSFLSLDDRAKVRLSCKCFRRVCDEIPIRRLVIHERNMPIVPGELRTGEQYDAAYTANCFNLTKLFDSPILVDQMQPMEVLVIHGESNTVGIRLRKQFNLLRYIELHCVGFYNSSILNAPTLQQLVLDRVTFQVTNVGGKGRPEEIERRAQIRMLRMSGERLEITRLGIDGIRGSQLRFLSMTSLTDLSVFLFAVQQGLFKAIEHVQLVIQQLCVVKVLNDNFPNLRRIDVTGRDLNRFLKMANEVAMQELLRCLHEDLRLYVFGVLFQTGVDPHKPINLLQKLSTVLCTNEQGMLRAELDALRYVMMKALSQKYDLSEMFQLINTLAIGHHLVLADADFLKNFEVCDTLYFEPLSNPPPSFENLTAAFSKLDTIILKCEYDVQLTKDMFDFLAQNSQLTYLFLENYQKFEKFDFLLKFKRLKQLGLCLYHPIDNKVVLTLIKKRPLNFMHISFIMPDSMTKEQLGAFKRRVNVKAEKQLNARGLQFTMTIHTNKTTTRRIVCYRLKSAMVTEEYPLFKEKRIFDAPH